MNRIGQGCLLAGGSQVSLPGPSGAGASLGLLYFRSGTSKPLTDSADEGLQDEARAFVTCGCPLPVRRAPRSDPRRFPGGSKPSPRCRQ